MPTYLGYCQGGKCRDTFAVPDMRKDSRGVIRAHYPQTFKQFWVINQLASIGITAWCGRKIDFYRTGKNRYAEAHESPFLPNYLFIEMHETQFASAIGVKFLAPHFQIVPRKEVTGFNGKPGLDVFKGAIEDQYIAAQRVDANSKAAIAEYAKGQEIAATTGPFSDMTIWFNRIVQGDTDRWPKIEGLVDMMGGKVRVQFDPLDVKAVR